MIYRVHSAKLFFIFLCVLFITYEANAQNNDKLIIALAPVKETCKTDRNFIPLPPPTYKFYNVESLTALMQLNFGNECKFSGFILKGKIDEQAYKQVEMAVKLLERMRSSGDESITNRLWLDSPGGLINEAMKIGDLIASSKMHALVLYEGICASACVFIYAASKTRGGLGEVGIHRPFATELSSVELSYADYLKKYDALTPIMKSYFSKYGVSPDQLNSYGLGYVNVASKEHDKAITIQRCGQDYYDLKLRFHATIDLCRKAMGLDILTASEKGYPCQAVASTALPQYHDEFEKCKKLKVHK